VSRSTDIHLAPDRRALVARAKRLEYVTLIWNSLEGIAAVVAGALAGSIALAGFGIDSFIEVTSGAAVLWRMSVDADRLGREKSERRSLKIAGICFVALAVYLTYESMGSLISRRAPKNSLVGIVVASLSLLLMPLLSRAKRKVAAELGSETMRADAKQTDFCFYLAAILLVGLLLNRRFGFWWADAAAAMAMVPIIASEAGKALRGEKCSDGCAVITRGDNQNRVVRHDG